MTTARKRSRDALTVHSWNVNGVRAVLKRGALQSFIAAHQPDVLCLQETKTGRDAVDLRLPGYQVFWNGAETPGYSGTALITRTEPLTVRTGFPKALARRFSLVDAAGRDTAAEGRVITAEFERCFVVNVYTPNAKDDLSRLPLRAGHWDPALLAHCRQLERRKPVVLCGDLNVAHTPLDLARPQPNVGRKGFTDEERRGFQAFIDAGFVDTLRLFRQGNGHYTWWSRAANARARNVGWRIDYVLVSTGLRDDVRAAEIHADVTGSDHCPVSIALAR
jgi:exodeoxyribonuclease-3